METAQSFVARLEEVDSAYGPCAGPTEWVLARSRMALAILESEGSVDLSAAQMAGRLIREDLDAARTRRLRGSPALLDLEEARIALLEELRAVASDAINCVALDRTRRQ